MRAKKDMVPATRPTDVGGSRWTYTRRGYALAHSLRQLKRNKIASLGTLLVLGVTLSLPVILYFSSATLATLSERGVRGESLTAYLDSDISDLDGAALAVSWEKRGDVDTTSYISRDQGLAMLAEQTDVRAAIEVLGVNPLPGAVVVYPATRIISAEQIQTLAEQLRELPEVARVQLDLRWVKRLEAGIRLLEWIGGLLALFLTLTAFLVIFNTIRLEMSRRRAEMEVANLLGAPLRFMNRPILYTGAIYGFVGGLISCIIALLALNAIRAPADDLSSLYQSTFSLTLPEFRQVIIVLTISVILGLAGAIGSLYRPSRQLTQ